MITNNNNEKPYSNKKKIINESFDRFKKNIDENAFLTNLEKESLINQVTNIIYICFMDDKQIEKRIADLKMFSK